MTVIVLFAVVGVFKGVDQMIESHKRKWRHKEQKKRRSPFYET